MNREQVIKARMAELQASSVDDEQAARVAYGQAQTARGELHRQLSQAKATLAVVSTNPSRWEEARDLRDQIESLKAALPAANAAVDESQRRVRRATHNVNDAASHRRAALVELQAAR